MRVRFTHITGSLRGSVEEYSLPVIKVGRALSSDLLLQDDDGLHRLASRIHAEFRLEDDDLVLYDLDSRNGTFVNGKAVERYALSEGDLVSFGLNGISFQVNFIDSPDETVDFLRATPLFRDLSMDLLHRVFKHGQLESYQAGSILFRPGEPSNTIYVVRNGIIELHSPKSDNKHENIINYIGPGQTLGETTALLGEEHVSEARIPEGAEIFHLPADQMLELVRTSPEMAEHIVLTFAHYLNRTYKRLSVQNKSKLQGSLFYFDLATVVQTLVGSKESGLLTIYSVGRGLIRSLAWSSSIGGCALGQVYIEDGEVRYSWAGRLTGEEAFFQLFQAELDGSFSFEQGATMSENLTEDLITRPSVSLLMEAVQLQDELNNLLHKYPEQTITFKLNVSELTAGEEKYRRVTELIYQFLSERPQTLIELLDTLPCCYYATYYVIDHLVETGQLTILPFSE
jgi:CRP-like cAMP-binding protein